MATKKIDGLYVCRATHPVTPNYSDNARGRVYHLSKKHQRGTLTLCNMKVSRILADYEEVWKKCFVCFNN